MTPDRQQQHSRAQALFSAGQLPEALHLYRSLITSDAGDVQALHMAGAIAGMLGDLASARSYCEKAVALKPDAHAPLANLAGIHTTAGDYPSAIECYRKALDLQADDIPSIASLTVLLLRTGQNDEAAALLERCSGSLPGNPLLQNATGCLMRATGRQREAVQHFRQALQLQPGHIDALCNLGAVLSDQLQFDDALDCYRQALRYDPGNLDALRNLGHLHSTTGRFDDALQCYRTILDRRPDDIATVAAYAGLLERLGRHDEAYELVRPLLAAQPVNPDIALVHARLAGRYKTTEQAITVLESLLTTSLPGDTRADIHFALGNLYDTGTDYVHAFRHYRAGNELDAAHSADERHLELPDSIMRKAGPGMISVLSRSDMTSELPVFIIGMPRSGTSLVEQILAAHPRVAGGGERGDMFNILDSLGGESETQQPYPDNTLALTKETLNRLAAEHLAVIGKAAGDALRFTDKTPLHGLLLGFIYQLLPGSRVIVCRRDPLDTCLSVYFNRFNRWHGYARSLESLGHYYTAYYRLIDHWTTQLDLPVLEIRYEQLVNEPEATIYRMTDFCGLERDAACLEFHASGRTQNTPSYDQVRQPLYTRSIGRWKNYREFLRPLARALGCPPD